MYTAFLDINRKWFCPKRQPYSCHVSGLITYIGCTDVPHSHTRYGVRSLT